MFTRLFIPALVCCVLSASAQQTDSVTHSRISERVVVEATRSQEGSPSSIVTIDSVSVRKMMMGQDAEFVLEHLSPSIISYSESGAGVSNYGSFRLRGIDQTRVNVTWNGVPLNDMIDQGVFFSNLPDVINGVHSVQIQRGVGVSANGTASFAGAVNIESALLNSTKPSGKIQLTAGSFNLWRGSAEVSTGRTSDGFSAYGKFTTLSTDGYRYNTASDAWSANIGAAWYGVEDVVKLSAIIGNTANSLGYYAVPKPLYDVDRRTNINDSTDHDDFGQHVATLQWNHAFSESTTGNIQVYYGGAGGDYYSGFRDSAGTLTQINYPLTNQQIGSSITINANDVFAEADITGGIHAYVFNRHNWETVSPESERPYYDDETQKTEFSGFVKFLMPVGDLNIYADVQLRSVQMTFTPDVTSLTSAPTIPEHNWFFVSPKIGVTYNLTNEMNVYASVGRTGREPTRFDLLGSTQISDANVDVLVDPNTVRAEYASDFEAGFRMNTGKTVVSVNGFYIAFTDEIAPIGRYIDQQFVQLRKNIPSSSRMGVELDAILNPMDELRFDVSGTFMKGNVAEYAPENIGLDTVYTNVEPVLTPNIMFDASATVTPVKELEATLGARYVSDAFLELTNQPNLKLDSWFTLNARLAYNFAAHHSISLIVNNILGEEYVTNGATTFYNNEVVATLFAQAQTNVLLNLELSF